MMDLKSRRRITLALLVLSLGLLIPGLLLPVISIRGLLKPEGVAFIAPQLLENGISKETVGALKALMDARTLALLEASGGDLRKLLIDQVTPQLMASLQKNGQDWEIYQQTRSIVGSVQHLYEMQSPVPATLILLFSIIVPVAKAALSLWAIFLREHGRRLRTLDFIQRIGKWSMADVFVVALFITYLVAQASQSPPGDPAYAPPMLEFQADVGPGFYWFTAYCLFSLAAQQFTARWFGRAADTEI
jgi:hypothetical protein